MILSYTYKAKLQRIVDGDTLYMDVDLGFYTSMRLCFRLSGINAPESSTPEGQSATAYLKQLLLLMPDWMLIKTGKPDKYGRWLVIIPDGDTTINQKMLFSKNAVSYMEH